MGIFENYARAYKPEEQAEIERFTKIVYQLVPERDKLEEVISHGLPAFKYKGRYLVGLGVFKKHMTLFPDTKKFTVKEPLSDDEIKSFVLDHLAEVEAKS